MLAVKFCARYFNMSRVAKNPITIIDGVTVNVTDSAIEVKCKIGEQKIELPKTIAIEVNELLKNTR